MADTDDLEQYVESPDDPEEARDLRHRRVRRRAIVLDPFQITGSPEGSSTPITGGEGSRVEDIALWEKEAPAAPPSQREYTRALRQREDESEPVDAQGSPYLDVISTTPSDPTGGLRRTRRRLDRVAEDVQSDPVAALFGTGEGATSNFLDEIVGAIGAAQLGEASTGEYQAALVNPDTVIHDFGPETYGELRDTVREAEHDARERSPLSFGAGEVAGTLAQTAVLPTPSMAGRSLLGRAAVRGGEGALQGAASALGASEGETPAEVGEDALQGGATGAVMAPLIGAGGDIVGGAGRRFVPSPSRARTRADIARIRSLAPEGTGGAGRVRSALSVGPEDTRSTGELLVQHVGRSARDRGTPGITQMAADIRALPFMGITSTPQQMTREAQALVQRLDELPSLTPAQQRQRDAAVFVGRWAGLGMTQDALSGSSPTIERALRQAWRRGLQGATLGGAGSQTLSGAGYGALGGAVTGALESVSDPFIANLGVRGQELLASALEGGSILRPWAPLLQAAARRSPVALAATYQTLRRTDPEFRAAVAMEEELPTSPAVEAITGPTESTPEDLDDLEQYLEEEE